MTRGRFHGMKEIDKAKKEEFERMMLIESLKTMPARVVATAYLYAMNYELYGEDVTKKWQTAVQNTASLQRAYLDGRRDEAQRQAGYSVIQPVPREALNRLLITHEQSSGWMQEHDRQMMLDGVRKMTARPSGKWETVPHKRARICSYCGCDEPYKFADKQVFVFNFCPMCGADMRGKAE